MVQHNAGEGDNRVLKLMHILFVLVCLAGFSTSYATETPISEQTQMEEPAKEKDAKSEGWSGFTIFLLVFVFALLFVISSATAMNRLGGKGWAPRSREATPPTPKKTTDSKLREGKDRFRL